MPGASSAHRSALPGEVLAGQGLLVLLDLLRVAFRNHVAAVHPGARAHVDHMLRGPDHVLVVLDHEHRVAEIAEGPEGLDQFPVVALVEPDGGLVEDVQDAHQVRADLGGEPDPLCLPAREGPGVPGEREIPEADFFEEVEPGLDLLDDLVCNLPLLVGQFQGPEPGGAARDRHVGDTDDGLPVDPDREHLRLEPLPLTGRAGGDPHVAFELAFPPVRLGLGIEPGGLGEEAFPFPGVRPLGVAALHAHRELHPLRGPEHQRLVLFRGEILDRREDREAVVLRDNGEVLAPEPVHRVAVRGDGAVRDAPVLVRDDEIGIELHLDPETMALLAGPERAVEREHPGLEFLERHPADRAGHQGRVRGLLPLFVRNEHEPLGFLQAALDCFRKPGPVGGIEPVDDDLDVLHLVPVEADLLVGPDDLPVDPDPGEPFLVQILEELLVRPLLLPDDGGEDRDLARVLGRDLVGDPVRASGQRWGYCARDRTASRSGHRGAGGNRRSP